MSPQIYWLCKRKENVCINQRRKKSLALTNDQQTSEKVKKGLPSHKISNSPSLMLRDSGVFLLSSTQEQMEIKDCIIKQNQLFT